MAWLITKYLLTSAVVIAVSEFAKRSDKLGALIAALPLVTLLALVWLHVENQSEQKIANHAWYTFWYVVPTFADVSGVSRLAAAPGILGSLLACIAVTIVSFGLFALVVRRFGIELL
jgi:ABC-type Na+ efflux pump permease subunit